MPTQNKIILLAKSLWLFAIVNFDVVMIVPIVVEYFDWQLWQMKRTWPWTDYHVPSCHACVFCARFCVAKFVVVLAILMASIQLLFESIIVSILLNFWLTVIKNKQNLTLDSLGCALLPCLCFLCCKIWCGFGDIDGIDSTCRRCWYCVVVLFRGVIDVLFCSRYFSL